MLIGMPTRCSWVPENDELYAQYHDDEWGVPVHDDRVLFEFLTLEGAQAGLSWRTILGRRAEYRDAFADFDPAVVATFTESDQERLRTNTGIIRNRAKIGSTVTNAQQFLSIQSDHGSFDSYIWAWTSGSVIANRPTTSADVPTTTPLSEAISNDLKKRGFRFVGPTITYAYLQAVGIVDDHTVDCFRA